MTGDSPGLAGVGARIGEMAFGYVLALAFVAAGLVGLVIGLVRLRAESRARAAELRGLLLTGNAVAASANRNAASGRIPRQIFVDCAPRTLAQDGREARAALERALDSLRRVERQAA